MLNWVLQHRVELTAIAWIGNILLCVPVLWMAVNTFNYRRKLRRHLRMSAHVLARYAVLDSWVRAGGALNVLGENVRGSIMSDYRMNARKHGEEYAAVYEAAEQDAERDLQAVLKIIKGAPHEKD